MGNTDDEVLSTPAKLIELPENIAHQPSLFSGWILSVVYKPDHSDITQKYILSTLPTTHKDIHISNKSELSSIIKNIHQQLNAATDEYSFLCINDCLVFRKDNFVSADITESCSN